MVFIRAPKTAYKQVKRKCLLCDKVFKDKASLVNHINNVHRDNIPENWSASRYENYLRTNNTSGKCIICKKDTEWNESTWKYNRLCDDPKCKEKSAKKAKDNMVKVYGKEHLLDDPEMQRKMIYSKKNSGIYYWSTDENKKYKVYYASSEEKKFLEMLDVFLDMDVKDVFGPSPNTYEYKYDNEVHMYIPDYYIASLNLEIEIKEPKDNQNMHPKIQAVDKVKEQLKDEMMRNNRKVNYIKINGNDYREFFAMVSQLKNVDTKDSISYQYDRIIESLNVDMLNEIITESQKTIGKDITSHKDPYLDNMLISLNLLQNKDVTYMTYIDKYIDKTKRSKSTTELDAVEDSVNHFELYLKDEIYRGQKFKSDTTEKVFEAKKALDKISKVRVEIKKRRKILSEYKIYTEDFSFDYNRWYEPIEESKEFKGYSEKKKKWIRPVFVVLSYTNTPAGKIIKRVTGQEYTHACISFDSDMTNMLSFNMVVADQDHSGFADNESFYSGGYLNDNAYYLIYMYLAPENQYNAMLKFVDKVKKNKDEFRYSFKGLFNYLIGRGKEYPNEKFCSEFVASVLKAGNPKLFDKSSNLYSPGDLETVKKLTFVDKGLIKDYNSRKVDRKVKKTLEENNLVHVTIR